MPTLPDGTTVTLQESADMNYAEWIGAFESFFDDFNINPPENLEAVIFDVIGTPGSIPTIPSTNPIDRLGPTEGIKEIAYEGFNT